LAIRVYDLAKELKISSGALMVHLKDMNIVINSHMKLLEEETANILRQKLKDQADHRKKIETEKMLIQEQLKNKRRILEESKKQTVENPFRDDVKPNNETDNNSVQVVAEPVVTESQHNTEIIEKPQPEEEIKPHQTSERPSSRSSHQQNPQRNTERPRDDQYQQRRTDRTDRPERSSQNRERTSHDQYNRQDNRQDNRQGRYDRGQRTDRPERTDRTQSNAQGSRPHTQRTDRPYTRDGSSRPNQQRYDGQNRPHSQDNRQRPYQQQRTSNYQGNTDNRQRRPLEGRTDYRDDRNRRPAPTDKRQLNRPAFPKAGVTKPEIKNPVEEKVYGKNRQTADEFGDKSKHLQAKLKNTGRKRTDTPTEIDESVIEKNIKATLSGKKTKKKFKKEEKQSSRIEELSEIVVSEFTSVSELSKILDVSPSEIITKFFQMGKMVAINSRLDKESLELICTEYELEIKFSDEFGKDILQAKIDDLEEIVIKSRPPVVTIMGHVDHGKTSILDKIRNTKVVAGESGGITQHIGAYQAMHNNHKITFIDTPGHEAFTAMRARGSNITDIAVIVVAANDGVKPQTVEAIDHAKAAGVALVVAINKIDLPDANVDKTIASILELNVFLEGYGGQVPWVQCSALKGTGIDELMEIILLTAELKELKERFNGPGKGVVLESSKNTSMGARATVLLQEGTLKKGDNIVVGSSYGKVRKLENERLHELAEIFPADIAVIYGLNDVPKAGDNLNVVENERVARQIGSERLLIRQEREKYTTVTHLGNIFSKIKQNEMTDLRLIVKGDVDGSVEAVCDSLQRLSTEEIKITIIRKSVGGIIEADVNLASASEAIIIGFNVRANNKAKKLAEELGVEIKYYQIIFEAIDDIKKAMVGLLAPEYKEKILGQAVVKQVFKIKKIGTIAGCAVEKGVIQSKSKVKLYRDDKMIYTGDLAELKHYENSVKEVESGTECGISIKNYNDLKEGDIIECFIMEEVARTL
jgi:translation initiation factor IF-2